MSLAVPLINNIRRQDAIFCYDLDSFKHLIDTTRRILFTVVAAHDNPKTTNHNSTIATVVDQSQTH